MPPKGATAAAAAAPGDDDLAGSQAGDKVKKKRKASRACQSCQKAHLTCSDTRPCARCVKRGEECVEGEKKKARYLYTPEELEALPKPVPKGRRSSSSASNAQRPALASRPSDVSQTSKASAAPTITQTPSQPAAPIVPKPPPPPPPIRSTSETLSANGHDLLQAPVQAASPAQQKNVTSLGGLGYMWAPSPSSHGQQPSHSMQGPGSSHGSNGHGPHVESLRSTFDATMGQAPAMPQHQQTLPADFFSDISPALDSSRQSPGLASLGSLQRGEIQKWTGHVPFGNSFGHASAGPSSVHDLGGPSTLNQLGLWPDISPAAETSPHALSNVPSSVFDAPQRAFDAQRHYTDEQQQLRASYTNPPTAAGTQQAAFGRSLSSGANDRKGKDRAPAPHPNELLIDEPKAPNGRGGHWDQGLEKGLRGFASGSNDAYALATRHGRAYRRLISHVRDRYDEADALKVVQSIADFRPKVLSATAHHTEDDTLFLEIALQRAMRDLAATLLPLTGTPTAIWRRTGEILAVGAEFCILTEWSQQDLIFRDTEDVPLAERGATAGGGNMKDGFEGWKGCFCWEVMEKQSVIEFYDNFSRCAFDGTTPSFNQVCTLLTPSGRAISCTACFSIRRDMFDFPSLIIAQFLPLLL